MGQVAVLHETARDGVRGRVHVDREGGQVVVLRVDERVDAVVLEEGEVVGLVVHGGRAADGVESLRLRHCRRRRDGLGGHGWFLRYRNRRRCRHSRGHVLFVVRGGTSHQRDDERADSYQSDDLAKHPLCLLSMRLCPRFRPAGESRAVRRHVQRRTGWCTLRTSIVFHSASLAYLSCNSCGLSPNC